jgi:hypothetical protein
MAAVLIAEVAFFLWTVHPNPILQPTDIGLTASIGAKLFTNYLRPFEITAILLLRAIVGAMTLARRTDVISEGTRAIPGAQLLAVSDIDPSASHEHQTPIESHSTSEAARVLEISDRHTKTERD